MEQALAFLGGVGGAVVGVGLIVLIGAVVLMRAPASSARRVDALAALLDWPFQAIRD